MTLLSLTVLGACSTTSASNRTTFLYPDKQPPCDVSDKAGLASTGDIVDDRNRIRGQRNRCAAKVAAMNAAIDKLKALEAKQKAKER